MKKKNIDKSELSLACVLTEAMISSPTKYNKVKKLVLKQNANVSIELIGIANKLDKIADTMKSIKSTERIVKLKQIAKRNSNSKIDLNQSLGNLIEWAINNHEYYMKYKNAKK